MFEQPEKKDVDYALSMLMHDARRQIAEQRNQIRTEANGRGMLHSNLVVLSTVDAADKIHAASMAQAKQILIDFIPRVGRPASEVTSWAKPHLENLGNAVLGEVHANGFENDHQRLTHQYRAVFQQRVEGTLREVEIGYVKGAGFSANATTPNADEWIRAENAVALLGMRHAGTSTICKRAHAGLIKARAERFLRDGKPTDNVDIPAEFWWAEGEAALNQNWMTGDFDTWIDHRIHLEAFGVTFQRSDIERARPAPTPASAKHEERQNMTTGKHIFIGHGQSLIWLKLKDFLKDRLGLTVDEFNRVPTAGVATSDRLEEMLKDAAFAFLILTAEDEQADGKIHARLNVVHEAGFFQGRLGFKRAIIMLEDGCEVFSNIHGLGQLRFPPGMIGAQFEEIRRVLEREKIVNVV